MNFIVESGGPDQGNGSGNDPAASGTSDPSLHQLNAPKTVDPKILHVEQEIAERLSKTRVIVRDADKEVHLQTRGITTIVEPGVRMRPDQFIQDKPPFSAALDGYVLGPPFRANYSGHINFDHHFDCDRPTTDATCAQVYRAIKIHNMFATFQKNGKPFLRAYVQDCDQDVCLSHWLLHNYDLLSFNKRSAVSTRSIASNIKALVDLEDDLDRTGGVLPAHPKTARIQRMAWVFDPYTQARLAGKINAQMTAEEMSQIILDVSERISRHVFGTGERLKLDTSYHELARGKGYMMIKESGAWARSDLFRRDVPAVISVYFLPNGKFKYSFAHTAFNLFPLKRILDRLNQMEGLTPGQGPAWAGAKEMLAGSPPETDVSPSELQKVVDSVIAEQEQDHGIELPELSIK